MSFESLMLIFSEHGNRSLVGKFSYLKVQQQSLSPPGKAVVKPASHCTEAHADLPLERKLSTAGSVYALYNMEYHTPAKTEHYPKTPLYNTMPRKKQRLSDGSSPQNIQYVKLFLLKKFSWNQFKCFNTHV